LVGFSVNAENPVKVI